MTQITDEMTERAMAAFDHFQWDITPLNAMRAALEAALAVAPDPAPDDAEFDAWLDELCSSVWYDAQIHVFKPPLEAHGDVRTIAARQRIIALHRQARHAGLRELRDDLAQMPPIITAEPHYRRGYVAAVEGVVERIDALLAGTEATDDR